MEQNIQVKYKLKKEHCNCCGRPFDKSYATEERIGIIDIKDLINRIDKSENEVYAEDLIEFVDVYLFDTFNYSLSSGNLSMVEKEDSEKVLKITLEHLKEMNITIIGEEIIL